MRVFPAQVVSILVGRRALEVWKYFSKWGKVGVLHFERKPQLKQTELTIGPIRLNTKFTVVLFSNEATETEVTIRESFTHHKTYMFKLLIQSSDT